VDAAIEDGSRVIAVKKIDNVKEGYTGTVLGHREGDWKIVYLVCWDVNVSGHSCNGKCEEGHGWEVYEDYIEKYKPKPKPKPEPKPPVEVKIVSI
jgi:hypothetical protein